MFGAERGALRAGCSRCIAERVGYAARVASDLQRELIVEEAVRGARPAGSGRVGRRGPASRAPRARFVAELERAMVEPARFTQRAARSGRATARGAPTPTRSRRSTRRYRERPRARGARGRASCSRGARSTRCGASRARWGATPVFVYGFDDFTPLELDALETLAGACGRRRDRLAALRARPRGLPGGRRALHERLAAIADEHVELEAVSDHYADELARRPAPPRARPVRGASAGERRSPGEAVRLHAAGGERAEVELAAARVLALLRGGHAAGRRRRGVPRARAATPRSSSRSSAPTASRSRSTARCRSRHTGLGRGLLALLRCAGSAGAPTTCWPTCARPGRLRQARAGRPARGRGAPGRAPRAPAAARELWEATATAGRSTRSTAWRARRRPAELS